MIREFTYSILSLFACTDMAIAGNSDHFRYPSDPKVLLSKPDIGIIEIRKDENGKDILFLIDRRRALKYRCETHVSGYRIPTDQGKSSRYPIRCDMLIVQPPTMLF
ncbi:hypothetical protein [Rhizobium sp. P44RR-XXIV]|uniref:hypothetical protein n=1 Tax=Rhizobium sp. P44RR-XXIV TaxID=1921145 RepID=UPI0009868FA0|nr:hypothetical protein [Rhizobium sp. P44RR-XXIV]TIX91509.1 hypothetical protein BSK43_011225 [Rhizobium sp. P44RR-XXIV]